MNRSPWPLLALSWLPLQMSAQWSPFCSGNGNTNGFVVDLAFYHDTLYATGLFTNICGTPASTVARWTGSTWMPVGGGLPDGGHALVVIEDALHLARYEFQNAPNHVMRWTGSQWSILGGAVSCSYYDGQAAHPSIYDIIEYNGSIVACGEFDAVGGTPMAGIMRWNGTNWNGLGSGFTGDLPPFANRYPHAMTIFQNDLIATGNFTHAGGILCNGIARWDGSMWAAMGEGFNAAVYGVSVHQGQLYAVGAFTASATTEMQRIARWNGTAWESPGFGFPGDASTFAHSVVGIGDDLYIAGGFSIVRVDGIDIPCGSIVSWDGTDVNIMDGGTNGEVEAIIAWGPSVLIGGEFTTAGGVAAKSLALWDIVSALPESTDAIPEWLWPIPSTGQFTIQPPNGASGLLLVHDVRGALVHAGQVSGNTVQLDLGLSPGQYSVSLRSGNDIWRMPLVIIP